MTTPTPHIILAQCCTLWWLDVTLPARRHTCTDCHKTPTILTVWTTKEHTP